MNDPGPALPTRRVMMIATVPADGTWTCLFFKHHACCPVLPRKGGPGDGPPWDNRLLLFIKVPV
jgi:hypothetical protein